MSRDTEDLNRRLLRARDAMGRSITNICVDVGFASLGTFSRSFHAIVGESPSAYRRGHGPMVAPNCFQVAATRPWAALAASDKSSSGEAAEAGAA